MRTILRAFVLVCWVLAGTMLMSRWWYANPEHFPRFSESFWNYVDRVFGTKNVDDAQNIEFFVVVISSFLVVMTVTLGIIIIVNYFKRNR